MYFAASETFASTDAVHADGPLIERALRGEQSAFESIMRSHNRMLFRAARGVVSDDAEAQDVVQETYLRAFTRLKEFQGGASLGTWMARIAINVALDALRKRSRSVLVDAQELDQEPSPEHMMFLSTSQAVSPESVLARIELQALLQSAIEGLPPIYRSVFILRAVQEMSVSEAAYCLQVPSAPRLGIDPLNSPDNKENLRMNAPEMNRLLPDVQSSADIRGLAIDAAGVLGLRYPVLLRSAGRELTVAAQWPMTVAVPAAVKGNNPQSS
jgi:RNA polymerase sigma-70 factor (ECF subfamily)